MLFVGNDAVLLGLTYVRGGQMTGLRGRRVQQHCDSRDLASASDTASMKALRLLSISPA